MPLDALRYLTGFAGRCVCRRGLPSWAVLLLTAAGLRADTPIDLADPAHRDHWLSHPVIGEPSYDTFVRFDRNPIYTGSSPYEWPVNGSLFRDPRSGDLYCYTGLYPKNYWPAGPCRVMRSRDGGTTWEDLGLAIQGDPKMFDGDGQRPGATPDVTVVADEGGYHMIYDWADPGNIDGGLAYAFARSPAGPFVRDPRPVHRESAQPLIAPGYKRVYAGSLVRRKSDWLILAAMSTPRNAGGIWALICMVAPRPGGPYGPPIFLRSPQQSLWFPQPIEFFPSFTYNGTVYACLTSVAANRSWQLMLKAPVEDAHRPEAWSVAQAGSLFHAEPNAWEAMGIWGQTFSGLVDDHGIFRIMYPARDAAGNGTINLASRPWDRPTAQGFWVSAPNAASLAITLRQWTQFRFDIDLQSNGPWRFIWNHRAPLGPDSSTAGGALSPLTLRSMNSLSVSEGHWRIEEVDDLGTARLLAQGETTAARSRKLIVRQEKGKASIDLDGRRLAEIESPDGMGAIGLLAEKGTCLRVQRCASESMSNPRPMSLLPLEGLLGAGQKAASWTERKEGFRYGTGYVGDFDNASAKWSFRGRLVALRLPKGPDYGEARVELDGRQVAELSLNAPEPRASSIVWSSDALAPGHHAVRLVRIRGKLPVDVVEFLP